MARNSLVVAVELALATISYALAVYVLAEARDAHWATDVLRNTIGLLVLFRLAALVSVGLYRRSLRYASVAELLAIAKTVTISSVLFWAFVSWQFPHLKLPIAVFAMDWAFLQLLWGALHFGPRVVKTQQAVWRTDGKRVIIVGAGDAGLALLKELALDSTSRCLPVAVVDDDPEKRGRTIYGVPIMGGIDGIAKLAANLHAEEILICIPSATPDQMRAVLSGLRNTKIPVRTLPSLAELVDGKVSRRDLRRPRIEDLLHREEISVDVEATRKIVGGKVVLVTGAGGSIGSELCRQIAAAAPRKLLLLDKSENSLFYANREACESLGSAHVKPLFLDMVYGHRLREILRSERPEIVFHAAAHKHVGMLELHPHEAIRNNVIGTRNLAEAARESGVARFVNISTDKAVNPCNYMGLSKKLTELCIQEMARTSVTRFMNVRFGNVAGSTGSVLRLFWEQIQKGAPIRVTDPRAMRYFMSVPEAVHLILRAAALGRGGETFVFEMGEPLNIYELAKTMALFAGLRPERDLSIEFTGLAEGEKITEELWDEWEHPVRTESGQILVIGEQDPLSRGILEKIRTMEGFLMRDDREGLLDYLQEIAPDFNGQRNPSIPVMVPPPPREVSALSSIGAA
ncbi:MAG: nucleoside-diphosphate sugar epimerase/dehydratase [Candidatus Acidiferrales bacterium]